MNMVKTLQEEIVNQMYII